MNSHPEPPLNLDTEHVDITNQLTNTPSRPGWRRRAVGTTRSDALNQIPRVGMLQAQLPIEPLRHIQRHIADGGTDQAKWVREAIIQRYLRENGNPDIAQAALNMQRNTRSRNVPRDQYGQTRNRQGRKRR